MAPVTAIRSIRLQKELWAWLADEAERRKTTVNGLVGDLLEVGRLRAIEASAKSAAAPAIETSKLRAKLAMPKAAPGSRLKGSKK